MSARNYFVLPKYFVSATRQHFERTCMLQYLGHTLSNPQRYATAGLKQSFNAGTSKPKRYSSAMRQKIWLLCAQIMTVRYVKCADMHRHRPLSAGSIVKQYVYRMCMSMCIKMHVYKDACV